jgi:hypothetical protein
LLERVADFPRWMAIFDEAFPLLPDMAFFADDFFRCWACAVKLADVPTKIVRMIKNKRVTKAQSRFLMMFQSLSWPNILLYGHRLDVVLMRSTISYCGRTGQLVMTLRRRQSLSKDLRECQASLN